MMLTQSGVRMASTSCGTVATMVSRWHGEAAAHRLSMGGCNALFRAESRTRKTLTNFDRRSARHQVDATRKRTFIGWQDPQLPFVRFSQVWEIRCQGKGLPFWR